MTAPDERSAATSAAPLALRVSHVGKTYRIYDRPIDRLLEILLPGRRRSRAFRALSDVSFEVARGEAVGVIGRNGSGKTTLLRLICGISPPTEGHIETHGRIAPLLALGAGFNPEFTGAENVRVNAAVLGLSNAEIEARFQKILDFADIGAAVDQPVRTYSSGMYARLAFAVAVSIDPEILVVDEVLSVGDELFARKCFARIEELRAKGVTILFVSHSISAVLQLCDRAILLDQGTLIAEGTARDVMKRYHALLYTGSAHVQRPDLRAALDAEVQLGGEATSSAPSPPTTRDDDLLPATHDDVGGNDEIPDGDGACDPSLVCPDPSELPPDGAVIRGIRLVNRAGEPRNRLAHGALYRLEYEVAFTRDAVGVVLGFHFRTMTGVRLSGAFAPEPPETLDVRAGDVVRVSFPIRMQLLTGTYFIQAAVRSLGEQGFMHRLLDVLAIRIDSARTAGRGIVSLLSAPPRVERVHGNADRPTTSSASVPHD
ncbi:MAG: ABC transporter ATP-binding protein [Phycisphaerae bacterium]|nr:ABC transporter ATP-binding protein [Phycisphaerae bacterium]